MTISVLIPWRTDHGQRQRLYDYVVPRWRQTGFEVCVGVDDSGGPFNLSRAMNRAFALSSGDVVVHFDADAVPDPDRLRSLDQTAPWIHLYAATDYLSAHDTDRVLAGADPWSFEPSHSYPFSTSHIAVQREAWSYVGGMDEGFVGWGGEDVAFNLSLARTFGASPEPHGTLRCLHHEVDAKAEWAANKQRLLDVYGQE